MAKKRAKHNPFRGFMDVVSEMNRMSDYMAGADNTAETQPRSYVDAWAPTTDILARGNDLVVRAELPGVERADLEITFSNGTLTISGERSADDDQDTLYYTKERSWGRFQRTMTLPEGGADEDIIAYFEEGLLEVVVHGGATAEGPTRIQVEDRRKRGR